MNDKIDDFSRKTFKIILHGDWRVTGKQNIILRNVNIVANIWTRKDRLDVLMGRRGGGNCFLALRSSPEPLFL
jgi:hypothetical protein